MFVLVVVAVLPLVGSSGCGDGFGRACHDVGCTSGVSFSLPAAPDGTVRIERCVNGTCEAGGGGGLMPLPLDGDSRITSASVRFFDAGGAVLLGGEYAGDLRPTRLQPNGADCEPTCYIARLRLTRDGELRFDAAASGR